mmetsp:Transcript_40436/g.95003  ORF Transcript_40436/g.95003 Transcript_40436/m.95003 type:complete len:244 (-) Transcript_40436:456-1187(-)|eukprot:CAMPEP_0113309522 /NCGR_PEP_ID=MMETSP0010_2-20120614/7529_1 /TAXON_ID=216773 ORGANISM="Corethron hystrix, Strain 308" /NCGR_SAMPLE_ID=MMETSP0010_2 /ASSEMBLY_ACC=CAM_ASM_000155 /LENGTH=243 /DNA_ID=CAMNT_0000164785 /DNA_START=134 /DNA_END=865 /DNA_ORIENTATION=+ /assembly_acc=CAM_ASM_000155
MTPSPPSLARTRRPLSLLFPLLLLLAGARAAYEGCFSPDQAGELLVAGQKTSVCLLVAGGGSWSQEDFQYGRLLFQPVADDYTHLTVKGSYYTLASNDLDNFGTDIYVHVASQNRYSTQRLYSSRRGEVFPFLTAVVNVDKGEVVSISWDDSCAGCPGNNKRCQENTYSFDGTQFKRDGMFTRGCYLRRQDECTEKKCGLSVYVVWFGTDKYGQVLDSFHSRLTAFPQHTILDKMNQLTDFID